jgi:Arc/MetJ-type ribon-helix-helix transcriptional regulator
MPIKSKDPSFHLLRVRIKKSHFDDLKDAAERETLSNGSYTTVSDIVRSAIIDWLRQNTTYRQPPANKRPLKPVFIPSNLDIPAASSEDEQLLVEAEAAETATALERLDEALASTIEEIDAEF